MIHSVRFQVNAGSRDEVLSKVQTFNQSEIEYVLHVKIPKLYVKNHAFVGVVDVDTGKEIQTPILRLFKFRYPWIDIKSCTLNNEIGLHVYKIELLNLYNDEVEHLFFAYRVQSDHPEKPYIYMDNARKGGF